MAPLNQTRLKKISHKRNFRAKMIKNNINDHKINALKIMLLIGNQFHISSALYCIRYLYSEETNQNQNYLLIQKKQSVFISISPQNIYPALQFTKQCLNFLKLHQVILLYFLQKMHSQKSRRHLQIKYECITQSINHS